MNSVIQSLADFGNSVLFFNLLFWQDDVKLPFLIAWLVVAAGIFSVMFGANNFRLITASLKMVMSKKYNQKQQKEIAKSQMSQQTSRSIVGFTIGSCVDIGSMFGIALMIKEYGVGSIFWVLVSGIIATSIRFAEVFMGHHYRKKSSDGKSYIGGPQVYIKVFFAQRGLSKVGTILASWFTIMLLCSTFFSPQLNQTASTIRHFAPALKNYNTLFCVMLSAVTILIVSGGFKRIISTANKIVSVMSKIYLAIAMLVLITHINNICPLIAKIASEAFTPRAGIGGFLSMIIFAIQRGFFCNESGMGSGAISHANSVNKNSAEEAVISMITPIFTTSVLCVTSGLIVGITDAHMHATTGLEIMIHAFNTVHSYFHYVLLVLVPLFGISTAIAWAYYGQRAFSSLCGEKYVFLYNTVLFFSYTICSMTDNFRAILNLADIANLGITIPNIIALFFASRFISEHLKKYKSQRQALSA